MNVWLWLAIAAGVVLVIEGVLILVALFGDGPD